MQDLWGWRFTPACSYPTFLHVSGFFFFCGEGFFSFFFPPLRFLESFVRRAERCEAAGGIVDERNAGLAGMRQPLYVMVMKKTIPNTHENLSSKKKKKKKKRKKLHFFKMRL
jgi:hypothetical protein